MYWVMGTACCAVLELFAASAGPAKIESFSYRTLGVVQTPRGELTAVTQGYFVAPDAYREDATMSFGKIVTVRRGDEAWAATPRGVSDLTPDQRKRTIERLYRNYVGLLWAVRDGRVEAEETPDGPLRLRVEGLELLAYFDEATGRLLELSMPGANIMGTPVTEKRVFSDFDDETNLPTRISVLHDEEPAAEITIKSWTLNDSPVPELFERPDVPEEKERDP